MPPDESLLTLRDELLTEFHFAYDPMRRLLTDPDWQTKRPFVEHRYVEEMNAVYSKFQEFCRKAAITHSFLVERVDDAMTYMMQIGRSVGSPHAANTAQSFFEGASNVLRELPCEDISAIFPAASPFATYCKIRTVCRSATTRVDIFDPYIDNTVFHRYLRDVDPSAQIIVMTETKRLTGDPDTRDGIVTVSELLALERPTSYRLCAVASIHDRYARIDDAVYHLGGSLKDAAKNDPYTISKTSSDAAIHKTLDDMIAGATEWFGPIVTKHRQA